MSTYAEKTAQALESFKAKYPDLADGAMSTGEFEQAYKATRFSSPVVFAIDRVTNQDGHAFFTNEFGVRVYFGWEARLG